MRGLKTMKSEAIKAKRRFSFIFHRFSVLFLCLVLFTGMGMRLFDKPAQAQGLCADCACINANHAITNLFITQQHGIGFFQIDPEGMAYTQANICLPGTGTRGWIGYQMCRHREEFIVFNWFKEHILASMMMMAEQLINSAMQQMFILGTFFDAQEQLETQQLLQELAAQAHKDYHPSQGMCEIGTLARSLASSQRFGEYNAFALSQAVQDRQMRNWTMSSAAGKDLDVVHRWEHFRDYFCNPYDNDQKLGPRANVPICNGTDIENRDMDVDYGSLVDYPLTIRTSLSGNSLDEPDDEALLALTNNLYGDDVFSYFPEAFFQNPQNEDEYMFLRSIVAKRSVAVNSFANIMGMKSFSMDNDTNRALGEYMGQVLHQLGVEDPDEQEGMIRVLPSYYAQMEFLTKKLYQRPEFYTNLYDKPVNIERKKAAMRALGLSQNMDLYKSKLRTEAALSVLTEAELYEAQEALQDRMSGIGSSGLR